MFKISTYGPVEVRTDGRMFQASNFWLDARSKLGFDVSTMFGVYIFARKTESGEVIPVYIGKTDRMFGSRLRSHFKSSRIVGMSKDVAGDESFLVFFVAITTAKRGGAAAQTKSRKAWVNFLETTLIAFSKVINPRLQNDKKTLLSTEHVCVPGFIGDNPAERNDAAKALADMLKPAFLKSMA